MLPVLKLSCRMSFPPSLRSLSITATRPVSSLTRTHWLLLNIPPLISSPSSLHALYEKKTWCQLKASSVSLALPRLNSSRKSRVSAAVSERSHSLAPPHIFHLHHRHLSMGKLSVALFLGRQTDTHAGRLWGKKKKTLEEISWTEMASRRI